MSLDFVLEYQNSPSPDTEERLAELWDLILELILQDLLDEQRNELA